MMLNGNNQTVPQVVVEDVDVQGNEPEQPANDPVQAPEDSGESAESPAVVPAQAAEAQDSALTEETCPPPDPAQISESHIEEAASKTSQTSTSDQPAEEISKEKKPDSDELMESNQVKTEPASESGESSLVKAKVEPASDALESAAPTRKMSVTDIIQSFEDCSLKETAKDLISFEAAPKKETEAPLAADTVKVKTEPASDIEQSSEAKPEGPLDAGHEAEPSPLLTKAAIEQVQTSDATIQIKPEPVSNLVHPDAEIPPVKPTVLSANQPVKTASKDESKPALDSVQVIHEPHEASITNPADAPSIEKPDSKEESAQLSAVSTQPTNVPA